MKYYVLLVLSILFLELSAQDRNLAFEYNLPSGLMMENGGRFINVKSEPFNAKGDGVTDDTQAFIDAYNYFTQLIGDKSADKDPDRSFVIFIPNGTYLVSNTIIYDDPKIPGYCANCEGITQLRFIGQSRENTIIKLADNAPGFSTGSPKEVLSFGKSDFNNTAAANNIRNITINTGSGNPDAVGLKMGGANNASGSNLLIKSEDRQGAVGLDFNIGTVVGWYHDITIEGFDIGIRFPSDNFIHPMVENTTLTGQNIYAMKFEGLGSATLRKIYSNNTVPALYGDDMGVFPSLVDCKFTGGIAGESAIELIDGQMFARNIKVSGYGTSIKYKTEAEATGDIEEWVSSGPFKYNASSPDKSMNLEIEDVPLYWNADTNQWANVHDYGAIGDGATDDSKAIQAALNSGKPVVYFTNARYQVNTPLYVPASVKLVEGFYTNLQGFASHKFVIEENSSDPIIIADFRMQDGTNYNHASTRTLVMDNTPTQSNLYTNNSPIAGGKLFINNCNGLKSQGPIKNVKAWIRHVNTEASNTQFLIKNSQVVVLSYKTEKNFTSFEAVDGSKLEIIGGQSNQQAWDNDLNNPALLNNNSQVSAVFTTAQGWSQGYDTIIVDVQGSETEVFLKETFPKRSANHEVIRAITLYTNYNPAPTPVSGVNLANDSIRIIKNDSATLALEVIPFMAQNTSVAWTSSDNSIVTVDSKGRITGINYGSANVIVNTLDGDFKDTILVNVVDTIHVESIDIPAVGKAILVNQQYDINYSLLPIDATVDEMLWHSNDPLIATVNSNGRIKGVAGGVTYIVGTTKDMGFKDSIKVSVVTGDPFMEIAGEVVIEAEGFQTSDRRLESVDWEILSDTAGSVGSYIEVPNGTGSNVSGDEQLVKTTVGYILHFDRSGDYNVYIRRYADAGGNNSVFAYFNGASLPFVDNRGDYNEWIWKDFGTVNVPKAGDYLFEFVRREDGYKIDRIVVTQGSEPVGEGPEESPFMSELTLVTGISLDTDSIDLNISETFNLTASISPDDATVKDVAWSSKDGSIAVVDSKGQVTAVGEGITYIFVNSLQGSFADSCKVNVIYPMPESFTISLPANQSEITSSNATFEWQESNYAESYNLQIDDNEDFSSPEIEETGITSTSLPIDLSALSNSVYFWKVIATNGKGSLESDNILNFTLVVTGIKGQTNLQEYELYPNPSSESILIKGKGIEQVSIYNTAGNLILQFKDGINKAINISTLEAGTYIVKIKAGEGDVVKLFVKE